MIYVDQLRDRGWVLRGKKIESCHMAADTLSELHTFAIRLGLKRAWFQGLSYPHYDLTPNKRALAVKRGARELSDREFVELLRKRRKKK